MEVGVYFPRAAVTEGDSALSRCTTWTGSMT